MSAAVITYADFTERGFTADEAAFNAALPECQALVERIVGPNPVDTEEKVEAYKMAVCAAVRMAVEYGLEPHASISIGSFSIGDTTPTGASGYQLAVQSALNFLTPAGLGFMGV